MIGILLVEAPILLPLLLGHAKLVCVYHLVHVWKLLVLLFHLPRSHCPADRSSGLRLNPPLAPLTLALGHPLHLHGKQLPGCARGILATTLASAATALESSSLQGRGAAIENEDGPDAKPQQLAYATEEADNVTVAQGVALLVANRFEKLVDPDGSVDSEALAVEGREIGRARTWLHDGPETIDTHDGGFNFKSPSEA
ncbi:hypothetical protein B0T19DRAFT_408595 [Cercophora scortea]|uniref:Uncharacterized protein n=1 Tax=Cercophora scortea TaxID=314031 RepID=A0AAE0J425_9PEZI|nr:hypothetical protein B0T19DRAFT_408595 [Cercophora scortea]